MNIQKSSDFVCMWCGIETTKKDGDEHILPYSLGSNLKLPKGDVCGKNNIFRRNKNIKEEGCNNKLSNLDEAFLHHPANSATALLADIKGRSKNSKKRIPKRGNFNDCWSELKNELSEDGDPTISMINPNMMTRDQTFMRAWHKCVANICCAHLGSKQVRNNYPNLIEFVSGAGSKDGWSFAIAPTLGFLPGKPFIWFRELQANTGEKTAIAVAGLVSGIWLGSPFPNGIEGSIIRVVSLELEKIMDEEHIKFFESAKIAPDPHYGRLGFSWSGG